MRKALERGFGVYFDPAKTTSGQRFFEGLRNELASDAIPLQRRPAAVLFNISAPFEAIFRARCRGQKVVLRVDGLYADRLCPAFLSTFNWPLRRLLSIGAKYPGAHDRAASVANLLNENYRAFARILLADRVIYQSAFCRRMHERYFPRKPCEVVLNGAVFQDSGPSDRRSGEEMRLVTIHDEWKPAKRIHDLVHFVQWAREEKKQPVRLTILGYTGRMAACAPAHVKSLVETAPYVRTLPRFSVFDGAVRQALLDSDIYCTFSYRDPCPNTVIESMAHGLPVVGMASGGMPEIVGDAGVLMPADDFAEGFFSAHRYQCDFPRVDFEGVLQALSAVAQRREEYRARVKRRFMRDLRMDVVAARYAAVMRSSLGTQ